MNRFLTLLRRMSTSAIPVAVMGVFMIASLWLLTAATENSGTFGRLHVVLVIINMLGLIVLVGLIGLNLVRLVRQYRRGATGSRLTTRMVMIFVVMAVTPVSLVFYFSLGFLGRGIDSWFDVRIENAMQDSLDLSKYSLDLRMREQLKQVRGMTPGLETVADNLVLYNIIDLRERSGASDLTLLTQGGRVIASSSAEPTGIIPQRPDESTLQQVRQNGSYVGLAPIENKGLHTRVAVLVADPMNAAGETRVLFALFPVDERTGLLADSVQSAYAKYKELVYLREPLKQSFIFTLVLVLLVSLLTAVWAAFFFAQWLVAPIRILAIGTRAVAAGNYNKKLPITRSDELGSLVQSFREMTDRVSAAQADVKSAQRQAERERAYLRAVLGRLSSGVITLDRHHTLRAVNVAASQILGADLEHAIGKNLVQLEKDFPQCAGFVRALVPHLTESSADWREEVALLTGGHKVLMCQGTHMPGVEDMPAGYVIVFDDVTTLIQAQRDAAWGEVARRLAHEIKNPLTPIQLSAERLRRKYLHNMQPEDAEVLDRSTHTIVQQVQAMKEMVQAFSEYARAPKIELRPLALNVIIEEVLDLYRGDDMPVTLHFRAAPNLPMVDADANRIRQLLHNLIRNAIESTSARPDGAIYIDLALVENADRNFVELKVSDNGAGIPAEMLDKLFEPYASTKTKGSGLGLAVVKRIVEEHSGRVFAENLPGRGASFVVRLPAISHEHADPGIPLDAVQRKANPQ
jgi:nitrogen fixation/metabolism regulation signal transduction histidine kinase